jgi:hypothetical protein
MKKTHDSGRVFEHNGRVFLLTPFHFLLFFVTFFTRGNFRNLDFSIERGARSVVLIYFLIVEGGRGVVRFYFFKLLFTVEGAKERRLIFFSFIWVVEGGGEGVIFFLKTIHMNIHSAHRRMHAIGVENSSSTS